ncbi:type II toxin-antitoxin system RelB/DinJ family antitoxin [Lonepinella sp. MS14437]|uniref:type II toxin-antitoxin system RelB/DinJ family antitoxin n=1 Tax=unclassified Lonepinella TaxID=2642006 RepID=UPI0036D826DF
MTSINFNIRLDSRLKERAFSVIESYGLTPSQAIKLFLNQIADTKSVPLSFNHHADMPNAVTRLAMLEAIENRKTNHLKTYNSFEEIVQDS